MALNPQLLARIAQLNEMRRQYIEQVRQAQLRQAQQQLNSLSPVLNLAPGNNFQTFPGLPQQTPMPGYQPANPTTWPALQGLGQPAPAMPLAQAQTPGPLTDPFVAMQPATRQPPQNLTAMLDQLRQRMQSGQGTNEPMTRVEAPRIPSAGTREPGRRNKTEFAQRVKANINTPDTRMKG